MFTSRFGVEVKGKKAGAIGNGEVDLGVGQRHLPTHTGVSLEERPGRLASDLPLLLGEPPRSHGHDRMGPGRLRLSWRQCGRTIGPTGPVFIDPALFSMGPVQKLREAVMPCDLLSLLVISVRL